MCWNWTRCCRHFRITELRESDKLHSSKHHLLVLILHLKNHQIDKAKWDAALLHSSNCKIYACSWYLDVVSPNWEALVTDNYEEIFPLTTKKKFTFQYLFTPFFVQQLGFFFQFNFRIVQKFQYCGIEHNQVTILAHILCMKIILLGLPR